MRSRRRTITSVQQSSLRLNERDSQESQGSDNTTTQLHCLGTVSYARAVRPVAQIHQDKRRDDG
jgi:hypothetical protein